MVALKGFANRYLLVCSGLSWLRCGASTSACLLYLLE